MIESTSDKKLKAIILVASATLMWSIGAPIGKFVHSSSFNLIFFRSLSGFLFMAVSSLFIKGSRLFNTNPLILLGGVFYAATTICFYTSLKFTTAANATVLGNTSPFFIAILGFFFLKERPLKRDWIILSVIMSGIIFCFFGGLSLNGSRGDILAICAAVSFSFLALVIKKSGAAGSMQTLVWGNLIAVAVTAPSLSDTTVEFLTDIPFFIFLGIFQMAVPFFFYARGQEELGTMEASMFKLLEPVAATVWTALLVSEIPSLYSIIGGGLVISALFFKTFLAYRKN